MGKRTKRCGFSVNKGSGRANPASSKSLCAVLGTTLRTGMPPPTTASVNDSSSSSSSDKHTTLLPLLVDEDDDDGVMRVAVGHGESCAFFTPSHRPVGVAAAADDTEDAEEETPWRDLGGTGEWHRIGMMMMMGGFLPFVGEGRGAERSTRLTLRPSLARQPHLSRGYLRASDRSKLCAPDFTRRISTNYSGRRPCDREFKVSTVSGFRAPSSPRFSSRLASLPSS